MTGPSMDSRQTITPQPSGLSSNHTSSRTTSVTFASMLKSSNGNNSRIQPQQIIYEDESTSTNLTSGAGLNGGNSQSSTGSADPNNLPYKPSRKNAVIVENTHETPQDHCLRAVANIIGGRNIHYCTRLSGGRICLYLTNQDIVNKLVTEGGIVVNDVYLPIRKYVTEATKFVISNCPPEMTDQSLKKILEPYGRVVSSPTRLKVSTAHEDLKHIRTWRRVVYLMIPSEAPEAPKRLIVTSPEGVKTTLYIDKDEIMCDYCKVPGHLEEKCKKKTSDQQNFPTFTPPNSHRLLTSRNSQQMRPNVINNDSSVEALTPTFIHHNTPTLLNLNQEETLITQKKKPQKKKPTSPTRAPVITPHQPVCLYKTLHQKLQIF